MLLSGFVNGSHCESKLDVSLEADTMPPDGWPGQGEGCRKGGKKKEKRRTFVNCREAALAGTTGAESEKEEEAHSRVAACCRACFPARRSERALISHIHVETSGIKMTYHLFLPGAAVVSRSFAAVPQFMTSWAKNGARAGREEGGKARRGKGGEARGG